MTSTRTRGCPGSIYGRFFGRVATSAERNRIFHYQDSCRAADMSKQFRRDWDTPSEIPIPLRPFTSPNVHLRRYFHSSTAWFDRFSREESRRLSHATATPRAYRATDGARIASRYRIEPPGALRWTARGIRHRGRTPSAGATVQHHDISTRLVVTSFDR